MHHVREYLVNRYRSQIQAVGLEPEKIPDEFDFLKESIIDSLGILELVTAIEEHFGGHIDFEELPAEHMTVLGPLAAHVEAKLAEWDRTLSDGQSLAELPKALLRLKKQPVEVWLATTDRSIRKGLMGVEADAIKPLPDGTERGMLFVFQTERPLSFWMFKTIVPLDIIYIDSRRRIVNSYSAQPLETRLLYPSRRPAQYVLEVRSGLADRLALESGDLLALPELSSTK